MKNVWSKLVASLVSQVTDPAAFVFYIIVVSLSTMGLAFISYFRIDQTFGKGSVLAALLLSFILNFLLRRRWKFIEPAVMHGRNADADDSQSRLLEIWSALLPARIASEELGDYIEKINWLTSQGSPRWLIRLQTVSAIFWTGLNTLSYVLKQLGKIKSAG